jgi:hypothetical protein
MKSKQEKLKLGRKFILASLPCDFHGKGESLLLENAIEYSQCHLTLIWTKLIYSYLTS